MNQSERCIHQDVGLYTWWLSLLHPSNILTVLATSSLRLNSLQPFLATRNTPLQVPVSYADLGVQHLGVLHSGPCAYVQTGTTKTSNPSVSPLGMVFTYINPFLMVKLFLTRNSALCLLQRFKCSPMHVLKQGIPPVGSDALFHTQPLTAGSQ